MASLHARHSRKCAISLAEFEKASASALREGTRPPKEAPGVWTGVGAAGCDCTPSYYTAARDDRGKLIRERVGKNRRHAEQARNKIAVAVDSGAYVPQANIAFDVWARQWLEALERKGTTIKSYRSTVAYACEVFGSKPVRRLGAQDVARFNRHLIEVRIRRPNGNGEKIAEPMAASTRAKHLRVLHACLASAIPHGYAASNPVKLLPPAERPRAQQKEAAWFTDEELPRLFAELTEGVFRTMFATALKTGMREGELVALTWGDVDLTGAVIRVRRTRTDGFVHEPKNRERRDVDLTPELVELLGQWWGECGRPGDEVLVFPGDGRHGYIANETILRRELFPAMKRAGIPRIGPTGEARVFHSLRHTFARVALENGAELTWLSRHLGHSSTAVTDGVYGHWSREARKRAMERLAGAFAV